jgi:hypothetical protein
MDSNRFDPDQFDSGRRDRRRPDALDRIPSDAVRGTPL